MINLSDAQKAVVQAPLGIPSQVLASAGSGKTRVLTERVRYILDRTKRDGVIAFTFTNKAAEEMKARLEGVEGVDERCWISTIHSVAQRVVDNYGHAIGLPSELHIYDREEDRKAVFLQALRDGGTDIDAFLDVSDPKAMRQRQQLMQQYLDGFSNVKRDLLVEQEARKQMSDLSGFWEAFQAYQHALLQSGGMDFDDILVFGHRILLEQPWCGQIYRAKYKHICVDEAQDLNRAQYEFLKALSGGEIQGVMMVGDPNQMVYGFNGSSHVFLTEHFIEDFSPQRYVLNENYRSSKAVISIANKLKPGSQVEVDYALEGKCEVESCVDEQTEATWICDRIVEFLALGRHPEIEGDITLTKIAILGRNRFVFQSLEKELKVRGWKYSMKRGERQVEPASVFGKVLDLAIRVRLNPRDWVDGKKLCAALELSPPSRWEGDNILDELSRSVTSTSVPFAPLQARLLRAISALDLEKPNIPKLCAEFTISLKDLGGQFAHSTTTAERSELERSLLELRDFRSLWTRFKFKGLGESLTAFRNALALGEISEHTEDEGLTLSTVHTMKGLERDIVFLMGMCEGVFPDYRAKDEAAIAEELNTAFVAVTRSRRWICISYPQKKRMPWGDEKPQRESRFLRLITS